ncbi:hypothetical protein D6853_03745 [Butyrivibrio sp. X503]|uniref:hypothetical protein n=1 Tax=Butyrivibrio sp. X503 TaxID=2364878 RepID=UPI000EAA6129|nr:hypothetical protein [Butyrivibrio sp. X503]RKM57140.1 hypothetical protein D6853_03745 [Butyrivibrio sp. X503]
MSLKYVIHKEKPYPLGCYIDYDKSLVVRAVFEDNSSCGITLFSKEKGKSAPNSLKIELPSDLKRGDIYSTRISGIENIDEYTSYNFYTDDECFCDPYAEHIIGLEGFGKDVDSSKIRAVLRNKSLYGNSFNCYDWGDDKPLDIPYNESLVYLMHVRGFTKSPSSGVSASHRGTFKGIIDKLEHIKALGVTTIELMPCYEMDELDKPKRAKGRGSDKEIPGNAKELVFSKDGSIVGKNMIKHRLNYWGFKKGYYFAPRTSYCADPDNAEDEVKSFIKTMHKNGIEVVLQFYFEEDESESLILDALRFWRCSYHVDGFHLKGARIPKRLIFKDPLFTDVKIWYDWFEYDDYHKDAENAKKYLASYNTAFLYASRRFLKGDDNSCGDFLKAMVLNNPEYGNINYVCDYEGFRLADLVSYEHKHNEENGENNKDGSDNNISWNCGIEGRTRKRGILELRTRQMKNIMTMLLLSQGTPMIFSGDEFGSSQSGNNNPYCQDNEIGWVDWKALDKNRDLFDYVNFLIGLRKKFSILHQKDAFKLMDYISCGYPDLSCHGREVWRPDLSGHSHILGMLYCGLYQKNKKEPFIYVCYNMNWSESELALPKLPDGYRWKLLSDTDLSSKEQSYEDALHTLASRSVRIYIGETFVKAAGKKKGKAKSKKK